MWNRLPIQLYIICSIRIQQSERLTAIQKIWIARKLYTPPWPIYQLRGRNKPPSPSTKGGQHKDSRSMPPCAHAQIYNEGIRVLQYVTTRIKNQDRRYSRRTVRSPEHRTKEKHKTLSAGSKSTDRAGSKSTDGDQLARAICRRGIG